MIVRILVPDLGATGGEVRLVEWLAREGSFVNAGQPLFTLETDKAVQDVEAFASGYLRKLLVPADSVVELGAVVALISETLEELLEATADSPMRDTAPVADAASVGTVASGLSHNPEKAQAKTRGLMPSPGLRPPSPAERERVLVSPAARRVAAEQGLDLTRVIGSGARGEIHLRDIQKLAGGAAGRRVALSSTRLAIARVTQQSKSQIPHFYVRMTIDMTDALAYRERLKQDPRASSEPVPTVNDLLLRAAAHALQQTPDLNARFDDCEIFYFDDVNIGVAIGLPSGVVIPVIPRADQFDLWQLAATTRRLKERAEAGSLSASEMSGGAITLSNLGPHGVDSFDAIINPPQAAVLAVGAAAPQATVYQGQLAIRTLMQATLSVDHRIADGVVAAQFLRVFKQSLELSESLKPKKQRIRLT